MPGRDGPLWAACSRVTCLTGHRSAGPPQELPPCWSLLPPPPNPRSMQSLWVHPFPRPVLTAPLSRAPLLFLTTLQPRPLEFTPCAPPGPSGCCRSLLSLQCPRMEPRGLGDHLWQ